MPSKEAEAGSVMELLRLAAKIRKKLGSRGHLLEQYLSELFMVPMASPGFQAAEAGYEESGKLRNLCFHAMDIRSGTQGDEKGIESHPFYPVVKKHFEDHPDTLRFRFAIVNRHFALLSQEFLKAALSVYLREEEAKISSSVRQDLLKHLETEITSLVGGSLMEQLNRALKEQFFAVPISTGFSYGFSVSLTECLAYVDNETGRQIFQLLMDETEVSGWTTRKS